MNDVERKNVASNYVFWIFQDNIPPAPQSQVSSAVPTIVTACIKHLETYGLHTTGIFRVSTSLKRIRQVYTHMFISQYRNFTEINMSSSEATLFSIFVSSYGKSIQFSWHWLLRLTLKREFQPLFLIHENGVQFGFFWFVIPCKNKTIGLNLFWHWLNFTLSSYFSACFSAPRGNWRREGSWVWWRAFSSWRCGFVEGISARLTGATSLSWSLPSLSPHTE